MWEVFPQQILDNSLHTSILVGLLITWGLYETLGWVFAGFVVAGYLAALAQVSPASLAVVLLESILCYGAVWVLGVGAPKLGLWSPVFGRERFLLFVLLSVPVRLLVTGLAMPRLSTHLLAAGLPPEALGPGLFGIGIVLVPLTANTFWKLGITRGLVQLGVVSGLTWLVVGGVLARLTNFHLSTFEQTFDALAVDVHSSTTAVLILITTAWIAAWNNLRYGWDFGGILVPALLGLLLLQPWELLATVVEIVVLYQVYRRLLTTRWGARLDLEGPRRLVSIYVVSYALKFGLALLVGLSGLLLPLGDVFGFGYLLTSLVVARCYKAKGVTPVLAPILWTSTQGVALAVPFALALAWITPGEAPPDDPIVHAEPIDTRLLRLLLQVEGRPLPRDPVRTPRGWSLDHLTALQSPAPPWRDPTGRCFEPSELRWRDLPGAPLGVLCGGDGPVLVVPAPRAHPEAAWLAAWLAGRTQLAAVVFGRHDPSDHPTLSDRAEESRAAVLLAASTLAGDRRVLELRVGHGPHPVLRTADAPDLFAAAAHLDLPGLEVRLEPPALLPHDVLELPLSAPQAAEADPIAWADLPAAAAPAAPSDQDLTIDLLLPAARRLAASPGPSPAGLRWLAARAGVAWYEPADEPAWVLVARGPEGEHVDRWVFRQGGGEIAVLTAEVWRWPGAAGVALDLHRSLDAGLTWLGAHAPHSLAYAHDAGPSLSDRIARRLLEPLAPDALSWPVLVEVDADGVGALHLDAGNEWLSEAQAASLFDRLAPGLTRWPGARPSATHGDELSTVPTLVHASRYQRALDPGRIAVLWFSPALLAEVRGSPHHEGRLRWYARHGVPVLPAEHLSPPSDLPAPAELAAALQAHADLPVDATLRQLQALTDHLEVHDLGVRLAIVVELSGLRCTTLAYAAPTCERAR